MIRYPFIRRAMLVDRSHAERAGIVVLAVAAATALRLALDGGASGVPFITYFPALMIAALLVGWQYATACAVASAITANWMLTSRSDPWALDRGSLAVLAMYALSCGLLIVTAQSLRRTVRELDALTAREAHLNTELQHRVKNMLAVVQALAQQSAKDASPAEFAKAFSGRLTALAKAHDVLSAGALESCAMPELLVQACLPFGGSGNIHSQGPRVRLPAASCIPLALALHELCTNALKHGALSADGSGRIGIAWEVRPDRRCVLTWEESGGPRVEPPTRIGLGRRLLKPQAGLAAVELDFAPAGLRCTITIDGAAEEKSPEPA